MKYMQEGGFQNNPLMRLTLGLTLALLVGFWATNIGMYFSRMNLRPSSVVAYYKGSEEDFRPPRSAASMLETTHMHLPMMGMVLLFLTHLVIFVPLPRGARVGLSSPRVRIGGSRGRGGLARPVREPRFRPPQGDRLRRPAVCDPLPDRLPRLVPSDGSAPASRGPGVSGPGEEDGRSRGGGCRPCHPRVASV